MALIVVVLLTGLILSQGAPPGPVLDDPVKQGFLKSDVVTDLFAFNPFMAKNFSSFRQKFLIEG